MKSEIYNFDEMISPYNNFSKTKFFKFVIYNDELTKNQDKPFLSLDKSKQHKIVILKMVIYISLIIFYLSSFVTIGIK